jgi:hypothetical protein
MVQTEAQSAITEGSRELIDARAFGLAAFATTTFDGADLRAAVSKPSGIGGRERL